MTSIYRTAYPYFKGNSTPTIQELRTYYTLNEEELAYIKKHLRGDALRLAFAVQLKIFQYFNYFPEIKKIPKEISTFIRKQLTFIKQSTSFHYEHKSTLFRHYHRIYALCKTICWGNNAAATIKPSRPGRHYAIKVAYLAAQTMSNPADIINVVIEKLRNQRYELPPFEELSRLVRHTREQVNRKLFFQVATSLSESQKQALDELLEIKADYNRSDFNELKKPPQKPTISHFKELIKRHQWLSSMECMKKQVEDIAPIKLQQFSALARSQDASDLKGYFPEKRYTLVLCMLHEAQAKSNDSIAITYCKTMSKMHKLAIEELDIIKTKTKEKTRKIANTLKDFLDQFKKKQPAKKIVTNIEGIIEERGGLDALDTDCTDVLYSQKDHAFHLLPKFYASKRLTLFRMVEALAIGTAHQDNTLIEALKFIQDKKNNKEEYLLSDLNLSFTTKEWRKLMTKKSQKGVVLHHKLLECCVFSHLAEDVHSGDIYISGADAYADYRRSFLPMDVCEEQMPAYCDLLGLMGNGVDAVKKLCQELTDCASKVDTDYLGIKEFEIDNKGRPILRKREPKRRTQSAIWLAEEIEKRMPERNILDILCNSHYYTGWAHLFSPLSGNESKMDNPIERYILMSFAYGTAMGPTQTVQHLHSQLNVSPHMLSWLNRRHVEPETLDKARELLINFSNSFLLPTAWGDGKSVAGDGNLRELREQNLISEFHMRYNKKGGIAYHHVANNYIALFSTFIPCGVWEAVAIIEGLLKNKSDIQPDTIHADTQGQSTVVFAFAYLLGFKLMPRIRNWKDYRFFRPSKKVKYKHIEPLFDDSSVINWKLIEMHWKDMMQVVLSIKAGKISSSALLRKLGSNSRKNKLYFAFQELGRVIRTQFLLEYISNVEVREIITDTTNKVESYNSLSEWCTFGSEDLVASNDEKEMEKAIKYNDIITNSIILQNIIDITDIILQLTAEGHSIRKVDVAFLSPYITKHIKRYGNYIVDLLQIPKDVQLTRGSVLW